MYAVFRETKYAAQTAVAESPAYREFDAAHAAQPGYRGTVMADVGNGRFLTVTLWESEATMNAARDALGPVIVRTLNPMMSSDAILLGTGVVVATDLAQPR